MVGRYGNDTLEWHSHPESGWCPVWLCEDGVQEGLDKKARQTRRPFKKGHRKWATCGSLTNNGETWKLGRAML